MLLQSFSNGRLGTATRLIIGVAVFLVILYPVFSRLYLFDQIPQWYSSSPSTETNSTEAEPLGRPPDYDESPPENPTCFSPQYLDDLRDHAIGYCSPESRSNITCFHSHYREDGQVDSLCFGRAAVLDVAAGKFNIDCSMREVTQEERDAGLIPFNELHAYWYETGPPFIFDKGVDVHGEIVEENEDNGQGVTSEATERTGAPAIAPRDHVLEQEEEDVNGTVYNPPRNFLLLKREGEGNLWHCLMEIFSAWMTVDVLRMSRDPTNGNEPFFNAPEDVADTQVVILDDRLDGPYFDLWTLFAQRKPLRLQELIDNPDVADTLDNVNLIVPLAGSSNPLWQSDWQTKQCESTKMLSVFVKRLLNFYRVEDPPHPTSHDPIRVTFVDRVESRRLLNRTALFNELGKRYPHISIKMIDFAAIPFPQQLKVARETDILVGVHGAGLTHAMFMREGLGSVVEIQPADLDHLGFRDIAAMRDLGYFRSHAASVPKEDEHKRQTQVDTRTCENMEKRDGWHWNDVRIESDRFFDLMDTAIRSMYSHGVWNLDIN